MNIFSQVPSIDGSLDLPGQSSVGQANFDFSLYNRPSCQTLLKACCTSRKTEANFFFIIQAISDFVNYSVALLSS
jgi:hypothetical protein